jgi:uncharacterized protein YkwD
MGKNTTKRLFGGLATLTLVAALVLPAAAPAANEAGAHDARAHSSIARHLTAEEEAAPGPVVAPPAACPGSTRLDLPSAELEQSMLCMTDFGRQASGLTSLTPVPSLTESARLKTRDELRCREFSHNACGREFTYWMEQTGYLSRDCWRVGEVLAWGQESLGTPRSIFIAWMRSPTHREIIFGDYAEIGADVQVGYFEGEARTRVWTMHLGAAGCPAPPTG